MNLNPDPSGSTGEPCAEPEAPGSCPAGPGTGGPGGEPECVEVSNKPGETLTVTVAGTVEVTAPELAAQLQAIFDALTAGIDVTITNDPLTVTIDGPVEVDFGPLTDWLTENGITVTVDGVVQVEATIDEAQWQELLDLLADLNADLTAAVGDAAADIVAAIEAFCDWLKDFLAEPCFPITNKEGETLEVEVTNWDERPVGIEQGAVVVGWTCDEDGNKTGVLVLCKTSADAADATPVFEIKWWGPGIGPDPVPYVEAEHGEACFDSKLCKAPLTIEALVRRSACIGYDNGRTPGSSDGPRPGFVKFDRPLEVVGWTVNGIVHGAGDPLGPYGDWTPQLSGWAAFGSDNDPNETAQHAFDFLPAPTWRYWKVTSCDPYAVYGDLDVVDTETGEAFTIYPLDFGTTYDKLFRFGLYDCDTGTHEVVWCQPTEGGGYEVVEAPTDPSCWVPCGTMFGPYISTDGSPCVHQDPLFACYPITVDEVTTITPVTILIVDCPGKPRSVEAFTTESWLVAATPDELVEVSIDDPTLLTDCDTGDTITLPDPPCEQSFEACPDPCRNVAVYVFGRPPAEGWTWPAVGITSPVTLDVLEAQLTQLGYAVGASGEKQYACPPPPGQPFVDGEPATVAIEPNPDPKFVAVDRWAALTTGKNDDRRDDLLASIEALLESVIGECPACGGGATVTEWQDPDDETDQSFGIGEVGPDGQQGIKYDTSAADLPAGLVAVHTAIIDCIGAGGVATITVTDSEGNTSVVEADKVLGDGDPQYVYGGLVVDGEPAGGKIRAMSVSCPGGDSDANCLRTSEHCPPDTVPMVTPTCPTHGGGSDTGTYGECECTGDGAWVDPDRGSNFDRWTRSGDVVTVIPVGTGGVLSRWMAGTDAQANGFDILHGRFGTWPGAPTGTAPAQGRATFCRDQVTTPTTLDLSIACATSCTAAAIADYLTNIAAPGPVASFTATGAAAVLGAGTDPAGILAGAAGSINGVFLSGDTEPFGWAFSMAPAGDCEPATGADQVPAAHDACTFAQLQALTAAVTKNGGQHAYCRTVDGETSAWVMQLDCDGAIVWDRPLSTINPAADPLS